jgi:hypothetical protein
MAVYQQRGDTCWISFSIFIIAICLIHAVTSPLKSLLHITEHRTPRHMNNGARAIILDCRLLASALWRRIAFVHYIVQF